jgi:hypothetical protein
MPGLDASAPAAKKNLTDLRAVSASANLVTLTRCRIP